MVTGRMNVVNGWFVSSGFCQVWHRVIHVGYGFIDQTTALNKIILNRLA